MAERALLGSELHLDTLLTVFANQASHFVDTRNFQIGLFDNDYYEIRYWTGEGVTQETPRSFYMGDSQSRASGIADWIRANKMSLLVHDFHREKDQLPYQARDYGEDIGTRSALFIPLVKGEQVIGLIAARSTLPDHFSERELRRLTILANQAAATLANAQTYSQLQAQYAKQELASQIAREVLAAQDLPTTLNTTVRIIGQTLNKFHSVVDVYSFDAEQNELTLLSRKDRSETNSVGHTPSTVVKLTLPEDDTQTDRREASINRRSNKLKVRSTAGITPNPPFRLAPFPRSQKPKNSLPF